MGRGAIGNKPAKGTGARQAEAAFECSARDGGLHSAGNREPKETA